MIIGLSGYAQSGKDTVANHLVEKHGFKRVAFADAIRESLYELNPIIASGMYEDDVKLVYLREVVDAMGWDEAKAYYPEVRRLLQVLGTEVGRSWNSDIWIDLAFNKFREDEDVVITDVRFKNEYHRIVELGGEVWRVSRTGVGAVNNHISENDLDNHVFKQVLHNDSDVYDLHSLVDYYLSINKRTA